MGLARSETRAWAAFCAGAGVGSADDVDISASSVGPRRVYRPDARWCSEMTRSDAETDLAANTKASRAYANRARRSLPGGVTAGVKYFDPYPIAMKKAKGCRLWDLDGNEYIDYCLSFGPLILGHGHPRVMKAIRDSLDSGGTTMFGTPHELEATYADRLACVIVEPVERSYIAPDPDFLKGLREITADHDIPLIFDEVMSGFRLAFGGAQHAYRVTPDLSCLGKIIGGGLPCGAFLGRSDILDLADPASGDFFHSSTFAGYPMAMAAGMATLDELEKPGVFDALLKTTRTLASGFEKLLEDQHMPPVAPPVGTAFSILFTNRPPRNYRDTLGANEARRSVLDTSLLARGIFVKPGKPFYLSTAHDDAAIRQTLEAFEESVPGLA